MSCDWVYIADRWVQEGNRMKQKPAVEFLWASFFSFHSFMSKHSDEDLTHSDLKQFSLKSNIWQEYVVYFEVILLSGTPLLLLG